MSDKGKKKPGKKPGQKSQKKREIEIEYDYQAIRTLIPYIYDWFANHHTTWPSQTCRWGPTLQDKTFKWKQRIFSSEQTDGTDPNRLLILDAEVCKKRISGAENLRQWKEGKPCQYIKPYKTIVHPGEVNKVRELPQNQNIVVTHTDAPELYLWNTETQPDRTKDKGRDVEYSVADIELKGHEDTAQFALGISKTEPLIASGGTDKKVLIWDIQSNLQTVNSTEQDKSASLTLDARDILEGHKDTVEDVNFKPGSSTELISVGDDKQILVWDLRTGKKPVQKVVEAHGSADLQCVDWDPHEGFNFATGCQKGALRIWDVRNLSSNGHCDPMHEFQIHKGGLVRIEWSPTVPKLLASGGEDKQLYCFKLDRAQDITQEDTNKVLENPIEELKAYQSLVPQELLFHHAVHRGSVVDFQWHQSDPYMMLSLSDEAGDTDLGGGTLQMWRVHDIIYRPIEECITEVKDNIDYIAKGQYNQSAKKKKIETPTNKNSQEQLPTTQPIHSPKVFTKKSNQESQQLDQLQVNQEKGQENQAQNGDIQMGDAVAAINESAEKEIKVAETANEIQEDGMDIDKGEEQVEPAEIAKEANIEQNGKVQEQVLEEKINQAEKGQEDEQESTKAVVDEDGQNVPSTFQEAQQEAQQEKLQEDTQQDNVLETQKLNGDVHKSPSKGKQKTKGEPLLGTPAE